MKKVVYDDKEEFILTNQELMEANLAWNKKENYFCERLGEILSRFFKYVKNISKDNDIYLEVKDGKIIGKYIINKNGKIFEIIGDDKSIMIESPYNDIENKRDNFKTKKMWEEAINNKNLFLDRIINQEDYYGKQKTKKISGGSKKIVG